MSLKTASALLIALASLAQAVTFRAASYNIGAHFTAEGYPDYSLGAPGTPDHDKVRDIIARINPDVLALQEIASADVTERFASVHRHRMGFGGSESAATYWAGGLCSPTA